MSGTTAIEWTEATWNPVTGCDKVSPGCAHCYAETFAERWRGVQGHPYEQGFDLKLWPERLEIPLRRRKPTMYFVNSMSDLFHKQVPDEFIARVWTTMLRARQHTFQVLTKRPERARELLRNRLRWDTGWFVDRPSDPHAVFKSQSDRWDELDEPPRPLPNVWLGVSIENRRFVHRADLLRDTPAVVRFVSAEPLLGSLCERVTHGRHCGCSACAREDWTSPLLGPCGMHGASCPRRYAPIQSLDLTGIDWLIVGGESGPRHRRIDPEWVRDLQLAAEASNTAFFFKQWGGRTPKSGGRLLDGREWNAMPERSRHERERVAFR